jgi:ferredoxin
MGLGTWHAENIELLLAALGNDSPAAPMPLDAFARVYGVPDFDVIRDQKTTLSRSLSMLAFFQRRPVIDAERCVHCGICVSHCPVPGKALSFRNGKNQPPVYDRKKCIRCFCCQEMCPQKAITAGRFRTH